MPEEPDELPELERQRAELYRELSQVGDFRPGSLNEVRRRCGKLNCAYASPDHPGHGPQYNLTRKVEGRTMARHLRPGPEVDKARREVAEYQRFRDLAGQVTEVNGAICDTRPVTPGRLRRPDQHLRHPVPRGGRRPGQPGHRRQGRADPRLHAVRDLHPGPPPPA